MAVADFIAPPPFSVGILLTLIVCLIASLGMFVVLVRRWTTNKFHFELGQWAGQRRFDMSEKPNAELLPPPLDGSEGAGLCARRFFKSKDATIAQLILTASANDIRVYHVCITPCCVSTPPVAIKPQREGRWVVDLFRLAPAASTGSERFQIFGNDLSANLRISESSVAGIAPPDIAILFVGGNMLLDFTARPFDPIEFDRMLALAQQLGKIEW